MAKVEGGTVKLELTHAEFLAIQEALKVAERYEYQADGLWISLLSDFAGGGR